MQESSLDEVCHNALINILLMNASFIKTLRQSNLKTYLITLQYALHESSLSETDSI